MNRNYLAIICLALAVSCSPPAPLVPQLSVLSIAIAGSTTATILGKNLDAQGVTIGSSATTILSSTSETVTVQLSTPLASGEYRVTVLNRDGSSLTRDASLNVLEAGTNDGTVPGEAFLAFKSNTNQAAVLAAVDRAGYNLVGSIRDPLITGGSSVCTQAMASLKDKTVPPRPTSVALISLIQELNALEPGIIFGLNAIRVGNTPAFNGTAFSQPSSKSIPRALPADFANVRVAVLDSGVNAHKSFALPLNQSFLDSSAARNFTLEDNLNNSIPLENDVTDLAIIDGAVTGHGTAVAGVLASTIRNTFPAGLESAAGLIVPIKVCETTASNTNLCRSSSITLGVCYAASLSSAARPVKVMNLSVGSKQPSSLLHSALEEAASRGISLIASAGNEGLDVSKPSNYPAFYSVDLPGQHNAIPGLMAVGSVKLSGVIMPSDFSSQGAWVSLSAVGEGLDLAKADGVNTFQKPGTSFSAPKVTATVLMLRAQNPTLSIDAVKAKLISSVTPIAGCPTTKCGAGALNILKALEP
jgi:Subtilase family/IPT/TIG domain